MKYIRYKAESKRYDYIKREILKLEKKLEKRAYKFQQGNDWHKGHAFVEKYLEKLYIKASAHYGE